jgi:ABC-type cobalamin/Fe3+-siderophores transport system ATPase subunit
MCTACPRGACKAGVFLPQAGMFTASRENPVMHGRFPHLGYPRRYGKEIERCPAGHGARGHLRGRAQYGGAFRGERQKAFIAMTIARNGWVSWTSPHLSGNRPPAER